MYDAYKIHRDPPNSGNLTRGFKLVPGDVISAQPLRGLQKSESAISITN